MNIDKEAVVFPRLTGPIGELVDAITDDVPYEHRALTAITYVGLALSGRVKFSGDDYAELQPRFYACLIGPPGTGKSAAMKEVKRLFRSRQRQLGNGAFWPEDSLGKVHVQESINSGPALVMALKRHPRLLYMPDEGSGAFDKFKFGRGLSDILRLLEDNTIGHAVRDHETTVNDAHFAMVLSATPGSFTEMWTGTRGAGSGLQSRFVLSYSDRKMPATPRGTNRDIAELAAEVLKGILSRMPDDRRGRPVMDCTVDLPDQWGAFTAGLTEGLGESISAARAVDMGRRFALIMAVCNGKTKVDDETIQLGREFIRYQLTMFDRFMPDDATTPVQRFETRILRYFERHPGGHTERDIRNNLRPENSPGGLDAFRRAFNNLTANQTGDSGKYQASYKSGELVFAGNTGSHGSPIIWKLNPERNVRDPKPTAETPWVAPWLREATPKPQPEAVETVRDPIPTPPTETSTNGRDPGPTPPTLDTPAPEVAPAD